MSLRIWLFASLFFLAFSLAFVPARAPLPKAEPVGANAADITWKKTVVDKAFRSEGVAVADVNRDVKMDILTGEVWYEAPKLDAARDLRALERGTMATEPPWLQRWLRLLGGRRQRRRLAGPDRGRLPRRAVLLVREPAEQGRPLEAARDLQERLQRDASVRRSVRHRQTGADYGLPGQADRLRHPRRRSDETVGHPSDQRSGEGGARHEAV